MYDATLESFEHGSAPESHTTDDTRLPRLRGSSWKRTLDKAMKDIGIPAKILSISKHLANRGSPFTAIPRYSGSPEIGYLNRSEIEIALAVLPHAAIEKVGKQERKLLADIRDWLQACSDSKRDLICFTR